VTTPGFFHLTALTAIELSKWETTRIVTTENRICSYRKTYNYRQPQPTLLCHLWSVKWTMAWHFIHTHTQSMTMTHETAPSGPLPRLGLALISILIAMRSWEVPGNQKHEWSRSHHADWPLYNRYHGMLCCSASATVICWCQQLPLIPWYCIRRAEARPYTSGDSSPMTSRHDTETDTVCTSSSSSYNTLA